MITLSEQATEKIRGNNRIIGQLMVVFNKHQITIDRWIKDNDVRLTTHAAVQIISKETGLGERELFKHAS